VPAAERPSFARNVWSSLHRSWQEKRRSWRLARLERGLAREPDSVRLLTDLAALHEVTGDQASAGSAYARLTLLHVKRQDKDAALFCTRKFELYGFADGARVYRELATLFGAKGQYLEAARFCRKVAEQYAADGHASAVAGYLRQLPPLGPHEAATRAELEALAPGVRAQQPPPKERPEAPSARAPRAAKPDDDVFLAGTLGHVSVFDIVHIVETNALTGRLDISDQSAPASLFFDAGRIVAARHGAERAHTAARTIFTIASAPFKVVLTDRIPPDEFLLRSNTGLLLDVLREIDESGHAVQTD
jgi:hypothetical protein